MASEHEPVLENKAYTPSPSVRRMILSRSMTKALESIRGISSEDVPALDRDRVGHLLDVMNGPVSSSVDKDTGLLSKDGFENAVEGWKVRNADKPELRIAIVYADINDFKLINDKFGHAMGDAAIVILARAFGSVLRHDSDFIARLYGHGDEFALGLPERRDLIGEDDLKVGDPDMIDKIKLLIAEGLRVIELSDDLTDEFKEAARNMTCAMGTTLCTVESLNTMTISAAIAFADDDMRRDKQVKAAEAEIPNPREP